MGEPVRSLAAAASAAAPAYTAPARIETILAELERVAAEYKEVLKEFEVARIRFQVARERFASVKRIAADVLGQNDWYEWLNKHENVRYAAMTTGDAIREALLFQAFDAADATKQTGAKFSPGMTIEEIARTLEAGGFEFRTTSPHREINGALRRLDGVKRVKGTAEYELSEASEILATWDQSEAASQDEK